MAISPSIAEPDGVRWTHDGFDVHLYATDAAYPDRIALLGGLAAAASAIPFGGVLLLGGKPDWMGILVTMLFWLLGASFVIGSTARSLASGWRERARNHVVLTASHLRWTTPTRTEYAIALEDVTGLRVRGPRPWRLVIERGGPERETELSCGTEAHAHWLGAQVARQVMAFHEKAGSAEAVPNAIRALSQRGRAISRVRS